MGGFGLLEVMLVTLVLGTLLAAGYLALTAPQGRQQAQDEAAFLADLDRMIAGFAQLHQRLPCADLDGDGLEDCVELGAGGAGALPLRTLGVDGEGARRGIARVNYVVYRGGHDLALLVNRYEPAGEGNDAFGNLNGFDFCTLLDAARASGQQPGQAAFIYGNGGLANIAYGLALAGRGGQGDFAGANAGQTASLEAPSRPRDARYDNLVRVRTFASLARDLDCSGNLGAMQAMRDSSAMITAVNAQFEVLKSNTAMLIAMNSVMAGVATVKAVLAGMAMAKGATLVGVAAGQLAAAIGLCAILIGCADVPRAAAALAAAAVATASAGVSIGLQAATIGLYGTAVGKGVTLASKLFDSDDPVLKDALADAQNAYQDALDQLSETLTGIELERDAAKKLADAELANLQATRAERADLLKALQDRVDAVEDADSRANQQQVLNDYLTQTNLWLDAQATLAESDAALQAATLLQQERATAKTQLEEQLAVELRKDDPDASWVSSLELQLENVSRLQTDSEAELLAAKKEKTAAEDAVEQAAQAQTGASNALLGLYQEDDLKEAVQRQLQNYQELSYKEARQEQNEQALRDQYQVLVDNAEQLVEQREQIEAALQDPTLGSLTGVHGSVLEILQALDAKGLAR